MTGTVRTGQLLGIFLVLVLLARSEATAQTSALAWYAAPLADDTAPPPVPREFRGVWIATVSNIDWPSRPGLASSVQKAELIALLDRAVNLRLNAVIFQVRPAADALYKSAYEPWSSFLTGTMGKAPSPEYDPLAFAVAEAHRRGLELHAWFNPYRARHKDDRARVAKTHISRKMPQLVKRYGSYLWMDPGEPAVRSLTTKVIIDVVRRYDIDGVHIDDYFYPYPERDRSGHIIEFPDGPSWKKYQRGHGTLSRDDWRRRNVDLLIEGVYREIKKAKPWVRFGISPFGIWRPGNPASVRGFDAYESLYADSRKWLTEGWLDYVTPQLYWRISAPGQSYPALLAWWAQQNPRGRHLWAGNAAYKVTSRGESWGAAEIVEQIQRTRDQRGAEGNIYFNMTSLGASADDLSGTLARGPYRSAALPPASPWLSRVAPLSPVVTRRDEPSGTVLQLTLRADEPVASVPVAPAAVPARSASPAPSTPRASRARSATARARRAPAPAPAPSRARRAPASSPSVSTTPPPRNEVKSSPERAAPISPRWWLVRTRYPDGWYALVADASTRTVRLTANAAGQLPELVAVNSVDRVGVESATIYLFPTASAGGGGERQR